MPGIIWSRIFCHHVCSPRIQTVKCRELLFCVLFFIVMTVGLLHTGKNIDWRSSRTGCWGRYVCLSWMGYWRTAGDHIMMIMICTPHEIWFRWSDQGEWNWQGVYSGLVRCTWGSNGETWGRETTWKTQTLPGVCHDMRQEHHSVHVASVHTIIKHTYKHISQLFYCMSPESKTRLYREETTGCQKSSKVVLFLALIYCNIF